VDRLFAVNERLVTYVRTPRPGRPEVAVVKVAAIGVGRITVPYADIITNEYNQVGGEVLLANPYRVDKGGEVGTFNLGSTVVLVFPPNMIQPQVPAPGQEIQLGHRLALLLDGPASP
jgi:phosphatidylserine decarboxylase